MNQQNELQQILERLEKNSRKQLLHARLQTLFCIVCGVCCAILLVNLLRFIPQLEDLITQVEILLRDLDTVTKELSKLDLSRMVENINDLVTTSQSGVEEALEKINEIDFETLNQAVKDLSNVVKPMADFVKKISLGGLL